MLAVCLDILCWSLGLGIQLSPFSGGEESEGSVIVNSKRMTERPRTEQDGSEECTDTD